MRRRVSVGVLTVLFAAAGSLAVAAQQEAPAGKVVTEPVPVRQYKALDPGDVYRAAIQYQAAVDEGRQPPPIPVRFRDEFTGREEVPSALQQYGVGNARYQLVAGFRTQSELLCMVPRRRTPTLKKLLGVPRGRRFVPPMLDRAMALTPGQRITVEGLVTGTGAGSKLVIVESVFLGEGDEPPTFTSLQLMSPGLSEPKVMREPGTETFTFPCTRAEGETVEVRVSAEAIESEEVVRRVSRMAAVQEGRRGAKSYGVFPAGVVYRRARDDQADNVDFTDSVAGIFGSTLPSALRTAPGFRRGRSGPVSIGYAFTTEADITCLVPADRPALVRRARRAITGEEVRIRGTITGNQDSYACLLVDYIGFPAQEAAEEGRAWFVTIEWPGVEPRYIWDYGYWPMRLPCQQKQGASELLQLLLSQYRERRVLLPAPPPAPQAEEEGEKPAEPTPEEGQDQPQERQETEQQ